MKKALILGLIALGCVSSSVAGTVTWGAIDSGLNGIPYTDNNGAAFAGNVYLFLLTAQPNTVSYSGGSWNLNGATLLATAGGVTDGLGANYWGASGGAWGFDGSIDDASLSPSSYYQAIAVTQLGQANVSTVGSGFWAGTTAITLGNYSDMLGYRTGDLRWETFANGTTGGNLTDWQPVPEPTSMALFALGAAAIGLRRRFRKQV